MHAPLERKREHCLNGGHLLLYSIERFTASQFYAQAQASLVQLVERRSPKPDVVGSSPTGRETYTKRWRNASDHVLFVCPHLAIV
jgi:hypothetical protein